MADCNFKHEGNFGEDEAGYRCGARYVHGAGAILYKYSDKCQDQNQEKKERQKEEEDEEDEEDEEEGQFMGWLCGRI